jgi:hypothetical protein
MFRIGPIEYPTFALALEAWIRGGMCGELEEYYAASRGTDGYWLAYTPKYLRCCALLTNEPKWAAVAAGV